METTRKPKTHRTTAAIAWFAESPMTAAPSHAAPIPAASAPSFNHSARRLVARLRAAQCSTALRTPAHPTTSATASRSCVRAARVKRILDAGTVLASHPRSFDRGQQIEDLAHVEALERDKRLAREHRATDRLHHAAPSAKTLFLIAAKRGHHLGVLARGLTELLNAHGPLALERAIAAALDADAAHLAGVRHRASSRSERHHR